MTSMAFPKTIILFCLGGTLLALATDRELFPFSNYPMYSRILPEGYSELKLRAIDSSGREFDVGNDLMFFPLIVDSFWSARSQIGFDKKMILLSDYCSAAVGAGRLLRELRLERWTWNRREWTKARTEGREPRALSHEGLLRCEVKPKS